MITKTFLSTMYSKFKKLKHNKSMKDINKALLLKLVLVAFLRSIRLKIKYSNSLMILKSSSKNFVYNSNFRKK